VRICLVYECLFPHTVGGAERWYRGLAEGLAAAGHEVSYLTLRQWERSGGPALSGVTVVTLGPRMKLYAGGRRRILPPLLFGLGVFAHLLVRGRRYDIVHTASFPYFPVLAAAAARPLYRFRLVVDWHEVWTRAYWREYLGTVGGSIGWGVQRLCARLSHRAFSFSRLHARRLAEEGHRGTVTVLEGEYAGDLEPRSPRAAGPAVVFAGRHIPEKRVPALVEAFAAARREVPELRLVILGDGPERPQVTALVRELGLGRVVEMPGFVDSESVVEAFRSALCLVLPSRREGHGLVVVEAAACGTPSVVVAGPDNAATELIEEGRNGFIARSPRTEDLAEAILRVSEAGDELRSSTAAWFRDNAERLSLDSSLDTLVAIYGCE
jgi:glycosyltransferase involved in cell wall biosynthesis